MNIGNNACKAAALAGVAISFWSPALAEVRHPRERPLTITRHTGGPARGSGVEYRDGGREIIAWGGFSANGYGVGRLGREASRREVRNEAVRLRTDGVYGYGFDGLGGTFGEGLDGGYNNPNYGNSFNSYVGYGGVPTNLAFGPAFANRHITDSDDLDTDADLPAPTPGELGYSRTGFTPEE